MPERELPLRESVSNVRPDEACLRERFRFLSPTPPSLCKPLCVSLCARLPETWLELMDFSAWWLCLSDGQRAGVLSPQPTDGSPWGASSGNTEPGRQQSLSFGPRLAARYAWFQRE